MARKYSLHHLAASCGQGSAYHAGTDRGNAASHDRWVVAQHIDRRHRTAACVTDRDGTNRVVQSRQLSRVVATEVCVEHNRIASVGDGGQRFRVESERSEQRRLIQPVKTPHHGHDMKRRSAE